MEKEKYRLLGTVKIPEDKKAEFNKYVLELLHKGGIRKSCEVVLDGKTFATLKPAVPDERGIVDFDYSIFERKLRQVSSYDTNTCTLTINDRGYNEFALVINLIMFMQEIYSEEMCLLMEGDAPLAYPRAHLRLLNGLLGVEFFDDKRYRLWDMFYMLYQNGIMDIKSSKVIAGAMLDGDIYCENVEAYLTAVYLRNDVEDSSINIAKNKIASVKSYIRRNFVHKILYDKLSTPDEQFEVDLKVLLNSNLDERQKMSERDDTIGTVAMCSLYMLPAVIVGMYAGIKKLTFWEAWEIFGNQQYTDFLVTERESKEVKEELGKIPFYEIIGREDENEFLEYWDGENLSLSDKMKAYIELWKRWFEETDDSLENSMEEALAWVAEEVSALDYDFVMEFLEHKDDENYQKAVDLFRKTKEKDCRLFPELTTKQAYEEIIKFYQCAEDIIAPRAYQALLHNKDQRKRLFGF